MINIYIENFKVKRKNDILANFMVIFFNMHYCEKFSGRERTMKFPNIGKYVCK